MKKIVITMLMFLIFCPAIPAKQVGDLRIPDSITLSGKHLLLNGAGERIIKVVFVKIHIYAAGLYLKTKTSDARASMDADAPMAIRLYMITNLASKKRLQQGWTAGLKRATRGKTGTIKNEIAMFNRLFNKDPREGDMYEIAYVPGTGISVSLNGKSQGDAIPGLAFKKAVFGIWLSDTVTDPSLNALKSELLGK